MPSKLPFTWQEAVTYLLTVGLPFGFIVLMGWLRDYFRVQAVPFAQLLENPMLLMQSAIFAFVGAFTGLRFLIRSTNPEIATKIRFTAMGVALALAALAISHLIVNGGIVNPR